MSLNGKVVRHKKFGCGLVVDFLESSEEESKMTIRFDQNDGTKIFLYPSAFVKSLEIEDSSLSMRIEKDIQDHSEQERNAETQKEEKRQQSRRIRIEANRKEKKTTREGNIAFKCNYCDGGKSGNRVGFAGICSEETMDYNVTDAKYVWCSGEDSVCRKYIYGDISTDGV